MKILWEELKKLTRQAQAKENIFGYKSTEANQLFLLYCFSGKILFTDKIHPQVKYLWFSILVFQVLISYFAVTSNLWYGMEKNFMALFDVMNVLGTCNAIVIGWPLVLYLFRTNIEAMIEGVDEICALRSSSGWEKYKNTVNIKKVLLLNLSSVCGSLIMSFLYLFDVMLFFEKEKIDNRFYYAAGVPLVEKFRSNGNYFIFNCVTNIILTLFGIQSILLTSFILYWGTTCNNALICAANEMNAVSDNLNSNSELTSTVYKNWNQNFTEVLIQNIKNFQKITRIINYFRGFFQVIGTVVVPASCFIAVAQLHVTISEDLSLILKLKSLSIAFVCAWFALLLYWTAEKLQNSVSELSLAVYSTPWYRSVEPRKLVYIFLCQTQTMKDVKITEVYPLSLRSFSRYLHGIWTYANALRKLT